MVKNKNFSLFFKANLLLTIVIFLLFLQYNNNYKLVDFFLTFLGAISTATLIYGLLYLLLFVFKFTGKFGLYLSGFIFVLINLSLLVDFFIYKLFKFHINGMVLNLLTSPDALDSIQAGMTPVIVFIMLIIAFIALEYLLIKRILGTENDQKFRLNSRLNKVMIVPLFVLFLGDKVAYGFSSLFAKKTILTKFKVIPLYQPFTFNSFVGKNFNYKPKAIVKNTIELNASIKYPLSPIEMSNNPQKFNIFIFASDSVSLSALDEKGAPRLEAFKQESITLNNHHSGGNATRFGIFSLMYGLNSAYWFSFLDANKGTVLFDVLKQLKYNIQIVSSTNTNWPEFIKTCYVKIQDSVKDDFVGLPWEKDKQSSDYFKSWVEKQHSTEPLFSFVFLDAPHGYSFPKTTNPFEASFDEVNYLTIKAGSDALRNVKKQYKNAVYYNDKLFGEMIDKLKEKDLYDDALIIFTSDHGQEFFEFGYIGHNTNFSSAQTHVPMLIKLPQSLKNRVNFPTKGRTNSLEMLTSHVDIVPTLLTLIGVKNPASDYSNGKNIFDNSYSREQVVSASWTKNAIITDDLVYVFSNTPDKLFNNEIRERKSYKLDESAVNNSQKVLRVMKENRRFLK